MKNLIFLDLELNQPDPNIPEATETIIQLGWAIFNGDTAICVGQDTDYITVNQRITPFIQELTGITDTDIISRGITLEQSIRKLEKAMKTHQCFRHIITWGTGDIPAIFKEIRTNKITRRYLDAKAIYQAWRLANNQSYKGGLIKAAEVLGITFEGRAHNAGVDAYNTGLVFIELIRKLKNK